MLTILKSGLGNCAAVALVAGGLFTSSAIIADAAQQTKRDKLWKDIGASERIDFSGRLQMLSQRIAASSCYVESGVAPDLGRGILMGSTDEIDRIMNALEFGNARMKIIGAETDARVLSSIKTVANEWAPIRSSIDGLYKTGFVGQDLGFIEEWNVPFFENATILVSEIAAQYSNPADLLQADAILVDLAGRQRMRTQQMLKLACEINQGKDQGKALLASIGLFDRTLKALEVGEPTVGLKPASSEQIDAALAALREDWAKVQPILGAAAADVTLEPEAHRGLFLSLNEMLIKSDRIVAMYTKYVKHTY